jgi:hypothetical protein
MGSFRSFLNIITVGTDTEIPAPALRLLLGCLTTHHAQSELRAHSKIAQSCEGRIIGGATKRTAALGIFPSYLGA